MKKALLRVFLSVFFVFLTFKTSDLNFSEVASIIKSAAFIYFPIIIALIVLNYLVSSYRWKQLLLLKAEDKPKTTYFAHLYFIGSFFNNFLVTSIGGDAYKIYKLGKKTNDNARAFAATFIDRFTGFLILVLISYFGFVFTWQQWVTLLNDFFNNSTYTYIFLFAALFGFWIAIGVFFVFLKFIAKKVKFAQKLLEVLPLYKTEKKILLWALLSSVLVQLFAIFSQYFAFASVGYFPPLGFSLFVLPVITLAGFFVPSINGIGVQDFLYKELFILVGVPVQYALSASLVYHFLRLIVSLFGGLLYAMGKAE